MSKIKMNGPGLETDGDGFAIGRDPRKMTQAEIKALGHEPMSPGEALRRHCLDCAGSSDEVRKCTAVRCPSWPFRTGKNPWRAPVSEERRAAARDQFARIKSGRAHPDKIRGPNAGTASPVHEPLGNSRSPTPLK